MVTMMVHVVISLVLLGWLFMNEEFVGQLLAASGRFPNQPDFDFDFANSVQPPPVQPVEPIGHAEL